MSQQQYNEYFKLNSINSIESPAIILRRNSNLIG